MLNKDILTAGERAQWVREYVYPFEKTDAGGYDKAVDKESFIDYLFLLHNIPLNEKIDEVFWQVPPPENYVKNKVPTERLW